MALSKEELLIERYKVIALWPRCRAKVGDILVPGIVNAKLCWVSKRPGDKSTGSIKDPHPPSSIIRGPEFYPHLFRKLEWWEERTKDQMPEYVKYAEDNTVCKVDRFDMEATSAWFMYLEGGLHPYSPGGSSLENTHWLPATEAEFINSKAT